MEKFKCENRFEDAQIYERQTIQSPKKRDEKDKQWC
jgi:hypothetical protein